MRSVGECGETMQKDIGEKARQFVVCAPMRFIRDSWRATEAGLCVAP